LRCALLDHGESAGDIGRNSDDGNAKIRNRVFEAERNDRVVFDDQHVLIVLGHAGLRACHDLRGSG
jgi:hypothetical protein